MKNRIKELRQKQNLTLKELSSRTGISDVNLSRYERGSVQPREQMWKKLADYFDVSIGYLQGTVSEEHEAESLINDFEKVYLSKAQETLSHIENSRLRISKISVNNENREELNHIVKELNTLEDNLKKDVRILKEKGVEQFFKDKDSKSIQSQNKKATDD
ncbi:helix-turn-helix domain-containing protein [Leuconostoc lactis]|uniref:helix-turn-helix domain-containing protein n=1 Tax=Leuconostoc lactis TaxID=1246 RepID=UPI0021A5B547|nr:transcriptional regulator [Leuconostoc lactis]MCT3115540.1 helix-turn-helix domain-containing protein [Leuconostoc lactis]